jgi:hypothetical protein
MLQPAEGSTFRTNHRLCGPVIAVHIRLILRHRKNRGGCLADKLELERTWLLPR